MDPYTKSREVWKCPLLKKYGAYDSGGKKAGNSLHSDAV